jgi:hypothetical protein
VKTILQSAFINALGTAAYIVLVAAFLFYAPMIFGPARSVLIPIAMLHLFVFSAALTGSLVFGRPVLWYLDGRKQDALSLLFWTLVILLGFTLLALVVLFLRASV